MYSLFLCCLLLTGCISVFLYISAVYGQFVLVCVDTGFFSGVTDSDSDSDSDSVKVVTEQYTLG